MYINNKNKPVSSIGALAILPILFVLIACGLSSPTTLAVTTVPEQPTDSETLPAVPSVPTVVMTPPVLPAGDQTFTFDFGGLPRSYILHIPPGYDPARPAALVLAFHGIGLDAGEMIRISGLSDEADEKNFVVAYPNGTGEKQSWNGGLCCGQAALKKIDDIGFTGALIDHIAGQANIDPARVYATGFSNGAIFAYRLACELSDRIAAVAPVSATQARDDQSSCRPSRSVPVMHFHGTADKLNPYDGGALASGVEFVSAEEAVQFWAAQDGCKPPPDIIDKGSIRHTVFSNCRDGAAVEFYSIEGGEHAWPGGEAVSAQVGEPTMEISASPLMWEFFAAHPMP